MNYPYFYPNQQMLQNMQQVMPQDNGFVMVRSEMEARNYPVGFGKSVTFKDETAPYVYSKTMGFSQLDKPIFEKYRLVKEESEEKPVDNYRNEIDRLWDEINALKEKRNESKSNGNVSTVSTKSNGNVKS